VPIASPRGDAEQLLPTSLTTSVRRHEEELEEAGVTVMEERQGGNGHGGARGGGPATALEDLGEVERAGKLSLEWCREAEPCRAVQAR
jgi:hypothetical protein